MARGRKINDLTGQQFGRLTVVELAEKKPGRPLSWLCQCSCGNVSTVQGCSLKAGLTKSCGCLQREQTIKRLSKPKHEHVTKHPNYNVYRYIMHSYYNGKHVCDKWLKGSEFFTADMGARPKGTRLNRIDKSSGFTPDNCEWVQVA